VRLSGSTVPYNFSILLICGFAKLNPRRAGPATLCFSHDLYTEAEKYLRLFRNNLDGVSTARTEPFFLSWQGKKMSSSMVTAQLNSFWNKAVGKTEARNRFNATLVRKSCVTKVHTLIRI